MATRFLTFVAIFYWRADHSMLWVHYSVKSEAYVSDVRVVLQVNRLKTFQLSEKFHKDLICNFFINRKLRVAQFENIGGEALH